MAVVGPGRIASVTTLRAPLQETLRFVSYHRNTGVDRVILFFDDPADAAIEALRGWDGVTAIPCDDTHLASVGTSRDDALEDRIRANAMHGLGLARDYGCEWSAHIDSDELIHAPHGLASAFAKMDAAAQVARFGVLEAVPDRLHHDDQFRQVTTFRVAVSRRRARIARALGCRDAFFDGEYLRGFTRGKAAVRTSADVKSINMHAPVLAQGRVDGVPLPGAHILHFDCCSLAAFRSKWLRRLDESGPVERRRPARRAQLEAFRAQAGDEEAIARLFQRLYFLPPRERIVLRSLGMLTTVRLDRALFDEVKPGS